MEELGPYSQHLGDRGHTQVTERQGHEETGQFQEKGPGEKEMVRASLINREHVTLRVKAAQSPTNH